MESNESVHVLCLLDVSRSMDEGDKLRHAKIAVKKALSELKPHDTFTIIAFAGEAHQMWDRLILATPENIREAEKRIDMLQRTSGTDYYTAFESAFSLSGFNYLYIVTDGIPDPPIADEIAFKQYIRDKNRGSARISVIRIGAGRHVRGRYLLTAIAEENGGLYGYANTYSLSRTEASDGR